MPSPIPINLQITHDTQLMVRHGISGTGRLKQSNISYISTLAQQIKQALQLQSRYVDVFGDIYESGTHFEKLLNTHHITQCTYV